VAPQSGFSHQANISFEYSVLNVEKLLSQSTASKNS
jgi:hypothetical protein